MATPTYTALAETTLGANAASVTFSSIPTDGTYRDLVLIINCKVTSGFGFRMFFNSDTGSNYSYVRAYGTGSSTGSDAAGSETGARTSAGSLTNESTFVINLLDYSATDKHKTQIIRGDTSSVTMLATRWANTAAINEIELDVDSTQEFVSGATFALFGIAS